MLSVWIGKNVLLPLLISAQLKNNPVKGLGLVFVEMFCR
jgi:hypothetical protein